jgi:hypothetical protein
MGFYTFKMCIFCTVYPRKKFILCKKNLQKSRLEIFVIKAKFLSAIVWMFPGLSILALQQFCGPGITPE